MTHHRMPAKAIPEWFLDTVRVLQHIDRSLRGIDTELRRAMRMRDLDQRLRDDLQYVRDAVGVVKTSLSVTDVTARQLLSELVVSPKAPARRRAERV